MQATGVCITSRIAHTILRGAPFSPSHFRYQKTIAKICQTLMTGDDKGAQPDLPGMLFTSVSAKER